MTYEKGRLVVEAALAFPREKLSLGDRDVFEV